MISTSSISSPYNPVSEDLPHDKAKLVPDTFTTWQSVFEIVNSPSAVLLWQFSYKGIKVLVLGSLENDD